MLESVIASPEVVHYICKRFDIKMSKKLGQNFLIKRGIVDEIVHAAELTPGEPVLEVGPGIGTLTQGLAQSGADVTAIELDRRLLEVLDTTLASYDNVRIVHGDVLKLDVATINRLRWLPICRTILQRQSSCLYWRVNYQLSASL